MTETKPINFKEANDVLRGTPPVEDLPIYRDDEQVISCWRIPWLRRLRVLLTGEVYLVCRGRTHPPLYVETKVFYPL